MKDEALGDIPASELVTLMDYCVWEVNHNGRATVQAWRDELSTRADAADTEVVRAIAICDEYLAPEGSAEALAAQAIAWPSD
ncbi:hypothetical protein VOM14_18680 [Paraburkholderia sp. MPAMCS5]|uniref:hypothetical protein n=1 Tax=Paraburkholderia sp. MPAMCS5 TaxID=3112563 RepID=UPI002E17C3F0|nr:hypothetical protein [Paraburkholderia sp. MPAMCS5]